MIQSTNQLLRDKEKLLEKGTTGEDGIENFVGRKTTLKQEKPKHVDNAEDASEVNKIELLEEKIKLVDANLKNVLDKNTKDETQKDKPQNMQPSDVQLMDGNTKNLDLNEAFVRLSADTLFTGRTATEEPYLLSTAAIANLQDEIRYFESRQCRKSEP